MINRTLCLYIIFEVLCIHCVDLVKRGVLTLAIYISRYMNAHMMIVIIIVVVVVAAAAAVVVIIIIIIMRSSRP